MKNLVFIGVFLVFSLNAHAELKKDESLCKKIKHVNELNLSYEKTGDLKTVDAILSEVKEIRKDSNYKMCGEFKLLADGNADTKKRYQRVLQGDPVALYYTLSLLNHADGAFAEELDIALGGSIKKHAKNFLLALKKVHGDGFCSDGLVGNLGIYDDLPREKKMLKERKAALLAVKDPSVKKARDLCVKSLDASIQKRK